MKGDGQGNMWPDILPPVITSPANGASGIAVALGLTLNVAPFTSTETTLQSTDWILKNAAGATVWQTSNGLLSALVPALTMILGGQYTIYARFNGANGRSSELSAGVTINT